jgi:hypothetical protein
MPVYVQLGEIDDVATAWTAIAEREWPSLCITCIEASNHDQCIHRMMVKKARPLTRPVSMMERQPAAKTSASVIALDAMRDSPPAIEDMLELARQPYHLNALAGHLAHKHNRASANDL